jgi:hypothetical protein
MDSYSLVEPNIDIVRELGRNSSRTAADGHCSSGSVPASKAQNRTVLGGCWCLSASKLVAGKDPTKVARCS